MINHTRCLFVALILASLALALSSALAQEPWKEARLFDAAASGKVDIVEAALKAGKSPNIKRPGFGSLLKVATVHKQLEVIKLLLAHGADPRAEGNEALVEAAVSAERMDILRCLVEAGAWVTKPKDTCYQGDVLVSAVLTGNVEILEYLLKHGADPKGTWPIADTTALQLAAERGDVSIMKLLLDAGADVNHRDSNGMSSLMLACKKGQQAAVEFLIAHGADSSFADGYDQTAQSFAKELTGENAAKMRVLCSGKTK